MIKSRDISYLPVRREGTLVALHWGRGDSNMKVLIGALALLLMIPAVDAAAHQDTASIGRHVQGRHHKKRHHHRKSRHRKHKRHHRSHEL
jgi:hypothetical protein